MRDPVCEQTGMEFSHCACSASDSVLHSSLCIAAASETYQYFDLPFCQPPEGLKHKPETLGEVSAFLMLGQPLPDCLLCTSRTVSLSSQVLPFR